MGFFFLHPLFLARQKVVLPRKNSCCPLLSVKRNTNPVFFWSGKNALLGKIFCRRTDHIFPAVRWLLLSTQWWSSPYVKLGKVELNISVALSACKIELSRAIRGIGLSILRFLAESWRLTNVKTRAKIAFEFVNNHWLISKVMHARKQCISAVPEGVQGREVVACAQLFTWTGMRLFPCTGPGYRSVVKFDKPSKPPTNYTLVPKGRYSRTRTVLELHLYGSAGVKRSQVSMTLSPVQRKIFGIDTERDSRSVWGARLVEGGFERLVSAFLSDCYAKEPR